MSYPGVISSPLAGAMAAIFLLLLAPASALAQDQAPAQPENVQVTILAPLTTTAPVPIVVGVGNQFTISLPSNRTTGYQWQLGRPFDNRVLQLIGTFYSAPETGVVGQGGTETWVFTPTRQGQTTVVLNYVRPWETGIAPARTQSFLVTVGDLGA